MNSNQNKIKQAFDNLHASPDTIAEVLQMAEEGKKGSAYRKRYQTTKIAAAALAGLLVVGSGTAAYAMDVGGIQRIIQLWVHGDQTDAEFTVQDGSYTLNYMDQNGNAVEQSGGGVAYEPDGSERPLTDEELLAQLSMPEVEYEEDGSVWIYYLNQKMEITDKFQDGICFVKLEAGEKTQYVTVKYQDGFASSSIKFIQPEEFNN